MDNYIYYIHCNPGWRNEDTLIMRICVLCHSADSVRNLLRFYCTRLKKLKSAILAGNNQTDYPWITSLNAHIEQASFESYQASLLFCQDATRKRCIQKSGLCCAKKYIDKLSGQSDK